MIMECCKHHCECPCHDPELGGLHIMACCVPCDVCSLNIKFYEIVAHMDECHNQPLWIHKD